MGWAQTPGFDRGDGDDGAPDAGVLLWGWGLPSSVADVERLGEPSGRGVCYRCGQVGDVWHYRRVVTSKFTGWEGQPYVGSGRGWCAVCAWLYRDAGLRKAPVVVRSGAAAPAAGAPGVTVGVEGLGVVLSSPLPLSCAVSVPVSGRKHLVPNLRWGCVVSDGGVFRWGAGEAGFVDVYVWLRRLGVGSREMAAPAPPWRMLGPPHVPQEGPEAVLEAWERLRVWQGTPVWPVAARWL